MTQIESLTTAVNNIVGVGIFPTSILALWPSWLPEYRKMADAGCAKLEVHKRCKSIIDRERDRRASGERSGSTANNIMSKLLQVSKDGDASDQTLPEGEMISKQFILTAAGFATTATTLAYGMVLLARHP